MGRRLAALAAALCLLAGCAGGDGPSDDGRVHVLCTTYPVYLLTTALTQGAEDVAVELLVDQQVSCLHDYTLTVTDMKAVERSDVIVVNGGGLEVFLTDALAQKDVPVIDCSAGVELLPAPEHHHHEDEDQGDHEDDPHFWMDPENARIMLSNIALGLDQAIPGREGAGFRSLLPPLLERLEPLSGQDMGGLPLITFHDGFQYFANAFGLELLAAIEEEEGAEASAKELKEIIQLVKEHRVPAIFVEKNGSRRSAEVIARETGCKVYELDMIMSGDGGGIDAYLDAVTSDLEIIREALG